MPGSARKPIIYFWTSSNSTSPAVESATGAVVGATISDLTAPRLEQPAKRTVAVAAVVRPPAERSQPKLPIQLGRRIAVRLSLRRLFDGHRFAGQCRFVNLEIHRLDQSDVGWNIIPCFQHDDVVPDGLILGKAISGGLVPLSVFMTNAKLMEALYAG